MQITSTLFISGATGIGRGHLEDMENHRTEEATFGGLEISEVIEEVIGALEDRSGVVETSLSEAEAISEAGVIMGQMTVMFRLMRGREGIIGAMKPTNTEKAEAEVATQIAMVEDAIAKTELLTGHKIEVIQMKIGDLEIAFLMTEAKAVTSIMMEASEVILVKTEGAMAD